MWGFALLSGLELAAAWGIIAFALNYIPFLGSFVATILPALFAMAQFELMATGGDRRYGPVRHSICDRQLPRAAGRRRGARHFAARRGLRRFLLGLPMGHSRRVHRRTHHHRHAHAVQALSLDQVDRDVAVGQDAQSCAQVSDGAAQPIEKAEARPVIDPRHGDVEADVSSTKSRSLLSLAGGLLAEISLPKLIMAWTMLLVVPGLLLGLAPIAVADWVRTLSGTISTFAIGIWSLLVLAAIIALGYFGWRALFRLAENSFWALNSVVVQPGYATCREVLRQIAERLFAKGGSHDQYAKLRAGSAIAAGLLICGIALLVLYLVWPSAHLFGSFAEIGSWRSLILVALANSTVFVAAYLAVGALIWAVADASMAQPRDLTAFDSAPGRCAPMARRAFVGRPCRRRALRLSHRERAIGPARQ